MKEHEKISRERLKQDVLKETGKIHRLTKCPLCGGDVSDAVCHSGATIHYERGSGKLKEVNLYSCKSCGIVWELEMFNSVEEKCAGAIEEKAHHLSLTGYSNCFCRSVVVKEFYFHKGERHSRIGYSEPRCVKE